MTERKVPLYPKLELIFKWDSGRKFLIGARFQKDEGSRPSEKLLLQPCRGDYVRAICILLLLAKRRGEDPEDENMIIPSIPFVTMAKGPCCVNTLATSFGEVTISNFLAKYFDRIPFISTKKGTIDKANGQVPHRVDIHPQEIRLTNIELYASHTTCEAKEPLEGDKLILMAENLEAYKTNKENARPWTSVVRSLAFACDTQPGSNEDEGKGETCELASSTRANSEALSGFLLWHYEDAVELLPLKRGTLYAILTSEILGLWKEHFFEAAKTYQCELYFLNTELSEGTYWAEYCKGAAKTVGDYFAQKMCNEIIVFIPHPHRFDFDPRATNNPPAGTWCMMDVTINEYGAKAWMFFNKPSQMLNALCEWTLRCCSAANPHRDKGRPIKKNGKSDDSYNLSG